MRKLPFLHNYSSEFEVVRSFHGYQRYRYESFRCLVSVAAAQFLTLLVTFSPSVLASRWQPTTEKFQDKVFSLAGLIQIFPFSI